MRKMIFLTLWLFVLGAAVMKAQVNIGGTGDPDGSAVLDLSKVPAKNLGLLLPEVTLNSTTDNGAIANGAPADGLVVYNPGTAGLAAGVYVWYASQWWVIQTSKVEQLSISPAKHEFSAEVNYSNAGVDFVVFNLTDSPISVPVGITGEFTAPNSVGPIAAHGSSTVRVSAKPGLAGSTTPYEGVLTVGSGSDARTAAVSFTVTKKLPTIDFQNFEKLANDRTPFAPAVTTNATGAQKTFTVVTSNGVATAVNNNTQLELTGKVGTETIRVTIAETADFASKTAEATLTVTKKTPTLTFSMFEKMADDELPFTPTVSTNSTSLPTFSVIPGNGIVTAVSDRELKLTGIPGTTTITVTVAENDEYFSATTSASLVVVNCEGITVGSVCWGTVDNPPSGLDNARAACSSIDPANTWRIPTEAEHYARFHHQSGRGDLLTADTYWGENNGNAGGMGAFNVVTGNFFEVSPANKFPTRCVRTVLSDVSVAGLIFMGRNLGGDGNAYVNPTTYNAGSNSSPAGALNGDYYQWGRVTDGHQEWDSQTIAGPLPDDEGEQQADPRGNTSPYFGKFITVAGGDWRSIEYNTWTDVGNGGDGNPCPKGFHVPTQSEWTTVKNAITSDNLSAFTSGKQGITVGSSNFFLPAAGSRNSVDGSFSNVSTSGYYWSSTVDGSTNAMNFNFNNSNSNFGSTSRANGLSVRCIKNY